MISEAKMSTAWIGILVNFAILVVIVSTAIIARSQLKTLTKSHKLSGYHNAMTLLIELKSAFIKEVDLIEHHFCGQRIFDKARDAIPDDKEYKEKEADKDGIEGKHFLLICNYYYRAEEIWVLRKNGLIEDDEWYTVSSLLKIYLSIESIRRVFYNHVKQHKVHQAKFIDDIIKLIGFKEEEYKEDKFLDTPFPDPYERRTSKAKTERKTIIFDENEKVFLRKILNATKKNVRKQWPKEIETMTGILEKL